MAFGKPKEQRGFEIPEGMKDQQCLFERESLPERVVDSMLMKKLYALLRAEYSEQVGNGWTQFGDPIAVQAPGTGFFTFQPGKEGLLDGILAGRGAYVGVYRRLDDNLEEHILMEFEHNGFIFDDHGRKVVEGWSDRRRMVRSAADVMEYKYSDKAGIGLPNLKKADLWAMIAVALNQFSGGSSVHADSLILSLERVNEGDQLAKLARSGAVMRKQLAQDRLGLFRPSKDLQEVADLERRVSRILKDLRSQGKEGSDLDLLMELAGGQNEHILQQREVINAYLARIEALESHGVKIMQERYKVRRRFRMILAALAAGGLLYFSEEISVVKTFVKDMVGVVEK